MQKINVNILQKPKTIQASVKNITPINPAKGTKTILQNGIHNIKEFEFISVNVKPDKLQEKEIEIISNGKYEVTPDDEYFLTKVKVDVNVPIPDGYLIPEGTLEIKDNGTFDVRQFEYVLIDVPIPEEYIVPEGKINITNTQEIDVTQYAKAQVKDENLKAENIAEGVEVLGVTGTMKGAGVDRLKKLLDFTKSSSYLFYDNDTITDLTEYLRYSDTENVTNMSYMFCDSSNLTVIPKIDTRNATNMSNMFSRCYVLETIDISHYNLSTTSKSSSWCYNCYSLKTIIIRSFGTKNTISSGAFSGCYHLLGTTNSTYNPTGAKDGFIYVPREMVDTLKSATNWSTYADQIRALEDYTIDGTTTGIFDDAKVGL